MRTLCRSMVLGLALLACAGGQPAGAQLPALEGSYTLVPERSDDIDEAIEKVVGGMNFITRPIARGRLKKTNSPYQTVVISQSPQQISIQTDDRAPIVTPADGGAVQWTREDGETFDVSTRWDGSALEQAFVAGDGQRINRYALAPDGTLDLTVTVTSPRLSEPMVYTLKYLRQN